MPRMMIDEIRWILLAMSLLSGLVGIYHLIRASYYQVQVNKSLMKLCSINNERILRLEKLAEITSIEIPSGPSYPHTWESLNPWHKKDEVANDKTE